MNTVNNSEEIFSNIYKNNSWKGKESRSGPSSNLQRTNTLLSRIPEIVDKYNIKTFLDIPCGDFFWMKHVVPKININYIGGDIVKDIIRNNAKQFSTDIVSFIHLDLVNDNLPKADILFCRDCLFHFSYADIFSAMKNILSSDIKYFMSTSHKNVTNFTNKDIKTGGWRYIDLFSDPFNFPQDTLEKVEDGGGDRYMFMWDTDKLKKKLNSE